MTNTKRTNKILSWILCLTMVLTILPMSVFAAEMVEVTGETDITMQRGVPFFGTGINGGFYVVTPPDGVTFTNIEWSVSGDLPAGITLGVNRAGGDGSARAYLGGTPTAMTDAPVSVTINAEATDGTNTYTGSLAVSITVEDSPAYMLLDELIQGAVCEVPMTTANTAEAVVAWVQNTWLPSLDGYSELVAQLGNGYSITVEDASTPDEGIGVFTAAVAGTEADPDGTDGSLFVRFRLDENYNYLDNSKECIIKATEYAEHTHDWSEWVSIGNGRHKRVCEIDSRHFKTEGCGGKATCYELAFCPDCKTTYGEYDQKNHSGGTEVRDAKEATETENGYTGDNYCLGCDIKIDEGSIIYAENSGPGGDDNHTHNYSYYNYDGTNHWKMCHCEQGQAGSVKPHSLVTTGVSTGHFEECTVCEYYSDVEDHVYTDDSDAFCSECGYMRHVHENYIAATCTSPAMCSCRATTGDKDPTNHTGGTEIRNVKEATETENGYTGDTYCRGCGAKLASGKYTEILGFVDVKYDDDVVVKEVTFQPIKGVDISDDVEVIVKDHTATIEPVATIVGSDVEIEYITVADSDIIVSDPPVVLNGVTYYIGEIIVINGEEFLVVANHGHWLGVYRLSGGAEFEFDGKKLKNSEKADIKVEKRENQKLNINGVTYDVVAVRDGISELDVSILYYKGKPAGQYRSETGVAVFNEGYDPATLKAQRGDIFIGSVTVPEKDKGLKTREELVADLEAAQQACDEYMHEHHELSPALAMAKDKAEQALAEYDAIAQLAAKKRYNVYEIGANDISIKNATAVSGTVTQTFDIPAEFVGNMNVKYIAYHGLVEGYELGKTLLSEDSKTLIATYEVDSFSPFIVYAFVEADEPEIKEITTQTSRPSSSGGGVSRYTIKFDTDGGSTVANKTVTRNSLLAEPKAPTKDGYTFNGWYLDEELTEKYDFDSKVTKGFTLYAKWEKNEDEKLDDEKPVITDWENPFEDVKEDDWFFEDVKYANVNELMNGVSETRFVPNDNLTRAMLVTVLYRLEGEPSTNRSIPFADVDMGAYYGNAVSWAKQNGIVNGVSETEFAPNDNITREQIAAILHRYAVYKGYDVTQGGMLVREYDDYEAISDYALTSMTWAVNTGLLKGKGNNKLAPKENAARAEIAAILHRFIQADK